MDTAEVPDGLASVSGALELGRRPADIPLPMMPVAAIATKPARFVLFPSFLYHAARPFAERQRLSVAFGVALFRKRCAAHLVATTCRLGLWRHGLWSAWRVLSG